MSDETPRQLKLTPRGEGEVRGKKDLPAGRHGKKEKEEKGNKWVIFLILVVTVIVSLVFYFSGGRRPAIELTPTPGTESGGGLFGPKVYQF